MQVVANITAMTLHPDMLQQHALVLAPTTMPELVEEDSAPSLWVIALFISISLHVLLLVLQKTGRLQSLRFYRLFCVIACISCCHRQATRHCQSLCA